MKNIISKSLPILFLVTSLAFMMIFHHEDELSDTEKADFKTISSQDNTTDRRTENDEEFKSISKGETVEIVDDDDDIVLEIPKEQWENNKEYYSEKFNLN